MKDNEHTFRAEIVADPLIWRNMNVYMMFFAGDPKAEALNRMANDKLERTIPLTVEAPGKCSNATLCLYVVPRDIPQSNAVADSPNLNLTLSVYRDGELLSSKSYGLNQWAGIQLVGLKYE